jgi:phosphoesterase RecJ-like protein
MDTKETAGERITDAFEAMERIAGEIEEASSLIITCHTHPEGDGIGSMLALMHALTAMGKHCDAVCSDGIPRMLAFLPGSDAVKRDSDGEYDVVIAVDVSSKSRFAIPANSLERILSRCKVSICIDHHIAEKPFGDICWVDEKAPATGLMVYKLIKHTGIDVTPQIAVCLYTAILTDTGAFRFENTTSECLCVASELVRYGATPSLVAYHIFERKHCGALKLWGRALMRLRINEGIVWTWLKLRDFEETGALNEDVDGLINLLRGIDGTSVVVLFREIGDGDVKVSLRSFGDVDVAEVARRFGGGGHKMASGCTIEGVTMRKAIRLMLKALKEELSHRETA